MLKLREYQTEDLAALNASRASGVRRNAMVLPTGAGKTVMMAHDIAATASMPWYPKHGKQIILVHRDELAQQTINKLRAIGLNPGLVMAESNDTDAAVIVASVQTLSRDRRLSQLEPWSVGHIVTDECHHSAADSYLRIYNYFGALSDAPTAPLMTGWTATLDRADGKVLGTIWQAVPVRRDILEFVERGDLRDPYGITVSIDGLDLASVARSRGDLADGSLSEAMLSADVGPIIAEKFIEHGSHDDCPRISGGPFEGKRFRQFVIFGPSIEFAEYMAAEMSAAGIPTATVIGETKRDKRRAIYEAINRGELHGISSVGVLTEGFDLPPMSCAIMARPTLSASLYVQMAGRVLRPDLRAGFHRIDTALILDCVGNAGRHKLATTAVLTGRNVEPKDGETLSEAVMRAAEEESAEAAAQEKARRERVAGIVQWEKIDLFHRSHSAWLQTHGGVWFIPAGDQTWFLFPDGTDDIGLELYRVGIILNKNARKGRWSHRGLPLDLAMSFAEQEAVEHDASVSQRLAPWRRRKAAPSPAQESFLRQLRLEIPETKSEASDMISVAIASRALDPMLKKVMASAT